MDTCSLVVSQQLEENLSTDLGAPRPAFLFSGTSLFNFQQLQQHHTLTSEFSIQSVSLFLTGLCFLSTLQNEECPQGKSCPMWISPTLFPLLQESCPLQCLHLFSHSPGFSNSYLILIL